MTERDGTTVDIHALKVESEFMNAGDGLRGKGFVQLHKVHVIYGQACP